MSKNNKFSYDPDTAFDALLAVDKTTPSKKGGADSKATAQKNVKLYPSQIKQIAHMAIERGIDQSALLREAWDEYYSKHQDTPSD